MLYDENKKLIKAARLLKEHCLKNKSCYGAFLICEDCLFFQKEVGCGLDAIPGDCTIPKVSRWSERDIKLAEALKEFGFTHICRSIKGIPIATKNGNTMYECPIESFENLTDMDFFAIEDILEKEKE